MRSSSRIEITRLRVPFATQTGATYVLMLLAIALLGVGLAATGSIWSSTDRYLKNIELNWVGERYREAIASYYEASPGTLKTYPKKLDDLLLDDRYLTRRRHIRRLYTNPATGVNDWELVVSPQGGVAGVRAERPDRPAVTFVHVPSATTLPKR